MKRAVTGINNLPPLTSCRSRPLERPIPSAGESSPAALTAAVTALAPSRVANASTEKNWTWRHWYGRAGEPSPLSRLESRLRCPQCGSRQIVATRDDGIRRSVPGQARADHQPEARAGAARRQDRL